MDIDQCLKLAAEHQNHGRWDQAEALYRQVLADTRDAPSAEVYGNLGISLNGLGRQDEAAAAFLKAIEIDPGLAGAHYNLGMVLMGQMKFDEAAAALSRAIELNPGHAAAHNNLGTVLRAQGKLDEAAVAYRRAIQLRPEDAKAYNNLGNVLSDQGKLDDAIASISKALSLNPRLAHAHANLGALLRDQGDLGGAAAALSTALQLSPNSAIAHRNLGNVLKDQGRLEEALACYDRAIALNPQDAGMHSNRVYAVHFHPGYDAAAILGEQRRWDQRHGRPLRDQIRPHANDRSPDRPLRIGYLSPNFNDHVVGRNILPLLRERDPGRFEIVCYDNAGRSDEIKTQLRRHADAWRHIKGIGDQRVAEMIRADRIDILVDLALHLADNRLLVMARKPAPVQVTFAGYPAGTGLEAIDYRLTDPYLDPPGQQDDHYVEKSVRLPDSFWCYDPDAMGIRGVAIRPPPSLRNGFITFGCLNNFCKVSDPALAVWAQVLAEVPGSRLLLFAGETQSHARAAALLERHGAASSRLDVLRLQPREQYFEVYHRIDIALDAFPYNGHTSSLDALWMGVPVVTRIGEMAVGRAGYSQSCNLGLPELAAVNDAEFIRTAVALANDPARLIELRSGLRTRMLASPLTDARRFSRNVEAAFRRMWEAWCGSSASGDRG